MIIRVTYILGGSLMQMSYGLGDNWAGSLAAIFGFFMLITGLGKLKAGLDPAGQGAAGLLSIAAMIGLASAFFSMIPLFGIFGEIGLLVAFILELVGLVRLRNSSTIGETGKNGALLLVLSMGMAILATLFGLIPFVGGFVASFFALGALILIFMGWTRV
ncbi:MAG: hypothetical protein H6574_16120 [Lewinellaceae bacterium]|nr:hypothetical protein [Lewinellaceae bacterium]